jgi:glycosyltransferase involved in cell wall biosynthesis
MSMHVCAVTSGRSMPSARFRVRQHVAPLRELGIEVVERVPAVGQAMPMPGPLSRMRRRHLAPLALGWGAAHALSRLPAVAASRHADLTWVERSFVPGLEQLAGLLRGPLVLDIDDAVWLEGFGGRSASRLARRAAAGIAGNAFLADWLSQYCASVHVIPTAIDCQRFRPAETPPDAGTFVIGWTGTSGNFLYLEAIAPALADALRAIPGAVVVIVADRRPVLDGVPPERVRFERWSADREAVALQAMHVGLMPLEDNDWTRGKCSFKMLQYMATGLPAVVSPVGMNVEVLAHGESGLTARSTREWTDALVALARDPERRRRLGTTGRAVAQAHYDVPVVAARLAAAFRSVVSAPRR